MWHVQMGWEVVVEVTVDHSGPCKPVVTSVSYWLMGSILVALDSTNYSRKIESLLAKQLVGG
jgi:hypothetical protein